MFSFQFHFTFFFQLKENTYKGKTYFLIAAKVLHWMGKALLACTSFTCYHSIKNK